MKALIFVFITIGFFAHAETNFIHSSDELVRIIKDQEVIKLLKDNGKILQIHRVSNGQSEGYQIITERCKISTLIVLTPGHGGREPWPWTDEVRVIESTCP